MEFSTFYVNQMFNLASEYKLKITKFNFTQSEGYQVTYVNADSSISEVDDFTAAELQDLFDGNVASLSCSSNSCIFEVHDIAKTLKYLTALDNGEYDLTENTRLSMVSRREFVLTTNPV